MFIYILNSLLILVWAFLFWLIQKRKPNSLKWQKGTKLLFMLVSFGQLYFLTIFRYNIGFDYQMYTEGFYRMAMEGFSGFTYLDWEIGFVFLTKLIAVFTNSHYIYMAVIAALCLFPVGRFIYRYSKIPWLSVSLYVNLYFFFIQMNFLRQAVAMAILCFAWSFLKNRKFLPYLGIVLLASLFHTTALIMIPLYLFVKIWPSVKLLLIYGYLLLFFYISSDGIINLLTSFFHQEYKNSVLLESSSFLYAVMPLLIAVVAWVFKDKLIAAEPSNRYLVGFVLLSAFFMIMMSRHVILERLSYYSYLYVILLVPELVELLTPGRSAVYKPKRAGSHAVQRTALISVRTVVLFSFWAITFAFQIYGMMTGVHGVFPYQSWL